MGIYYSTTIAYGVSGDVNETLPAPLQAIKDEEGYLGEEYVNPWLAEQGLDQIGFVEVGSYMTGELFWLFYVEGTYSHFDQSDGEGVYTFDAPHLTAEQKTQMHQVRALLGAPTAKIPPFKWTVAFNVS